MPNCDRVPIFQPVSESDGTFDDLTSKTQSNAAPQAAQPRETQEYQVAMALELWRQQQEEHFQHEVRVKQVLRVICQSLRLGKYSEKLLLYRNNIFYFYLVIFRISKITTNC